MGVTPPPRDPPPGTHPLGVPGEGLGKGLPHRLRFRSDNDCDIDIDVPGESLAMSMSMETSLTRRRGRRISFLKEEK